MKDIIMIALIIAGIIILFSCIIIFIILSNICKECYLKRKNIQIQNSLHIGNGEVIIKTLETMIEDSIDTYIILNLGHNETKYIPEKEQKKMTMQVYNDVMEKLSPSFIDLLSLIYAKEYIPNEISRRIQLAVMTYIIQTNSSFNK